METEALERPADLTIWRTLPASSPLAQPERYDTLREALAAGTVSDDVILNILARRREPPRPLSIVTPDDLALRHPPLADCDRYDSLRGLHAAA